MKTTGQPKKIGDIVKTAMILGLVMINSIANAGCNITKQGENPETAHYCNFHLTKFAAFTGKETTETEEEILLEKWMYSTDAATWNLNYEEEILTEDWMTNPSKWLK